MFDKTYDVILQGVIPVGRFNGIRDFVENYYYTKGDHGSWLEEMREECMNDSLLEEDYSYEDSVQFYINDIETWAQQDAQSSGFEWGGYYFKEVPTIF